MRVRMLCFCRFISRMISFYRQYQFKFSLMYSELIENIRNYFDNKHQQGSHDPSSVLVVASHAVLHPAIRFCPSHSGMASLELSKFQWYKWPKAALHVPLIRQSIVLSGAVFRGVCFHWGCFCITSGIDVTALLHFSSSWFSILFLGGVLLIVKGGAMSIMDKALFE